MTMAEIDRRRACLGEARSRVRRFGVANEDNEYHVGGRYRRHLDDGRLTVVGAEEAVLEALREWWVQDCKEAT